MIIREASLNDKEKVIDLMKKADNREREEAEKKFNSSVLTKKKRRILVIEEDKQLIGFTAIKEENEDVNAAKVLDLNKTLCINWIALLPESRKKGLGSELLNAAEKYAKKWNKEGIWLDCRERVVPFYQKNGYKIVGKFVKDKNREGFVMLKKIK